MIKPHRTHPLWLAFMLHRISGIGLALFLPFHFYVLSLALTDRAALDGFLRWTDYTLVKFAEVGLVFLLAMHLFGGLRLLALEMLPGARAWTARQKSLAAASVAMAAFVSGVFFFQAV